MSFERHQPTSADVADRVAECAVVENASWKGHGGKGIFSGAGLALFTEVARRFADRGWLDIGLLRVDGRVVSYRFGFRQRGVFYDYNLAYHPEFAAGAPGRVLLAEMIASSRAQGLRCFDASRSGLGDTHLLADWCDERIDHHELWLFNDNLRGYLLQAARQRLRPLVNRLRASRGW